jgi:hypothetical protein
MNKSSTLPIAPVRPIFEVQRAADRGNYDHGWLRTSSFSFADYYDSQHMNWGALRVFNDDRVSERPKWAGCSPRIDCCRQHGLRLWRPGHLMIS